LWAGVLLEQIDRLLRNGQLGLLRLIHTLLDTSVDSVLSSPVVDRLATQVQIVRDATIR
jgi:hypothetical protein